MSLTQLHVWRADHEETESLAHGLISLGIEYRGDGALHSYDQNVQMFYTNMAAQLQSLDIDVPSTELGGTPTHCVLAEATLLRRLALRSVCGDELYEVFGGRQSSARRSVTLPTS